MKRFCKTVIDFLALILILPCYLLFLINSLLLGSRQAFAGWSQAMSLLPGLIGVTLRRAFYKRILPRVGKDACISFGVIFSHPTAEIGGTVYIGPYCCLGDVTLENDVLLGSNVSITNGNGQHSTERLDIPIREQPGIWPRVTIGEDTWIGDRAVVMANVGKKCLIGAGSVVTKPIPDYAVAAGNPARILRYRNQSQLETNETPESRELRQEFPAPI